jgi:glycosyltransferase involved in cell wall biosynthesis
MVTALGESLPQLSLVDRFEVVFVDDASTDDTAGLLAQHRFDWLTLVSLPKRGGQSAALSAGIDVARHDVVGRIDGDLQTSPDDFDLLLHGLAHGFDCAHGVRAQRYDSVTRRVSSRVANAVRRRVLGDPFFDIACPLTVFRKECVRHVPRVDSFHRFLPYLIQLQGCTVTQVPVRHFPRLAGQTKYGVLDRLGIGITSLLAMRWYARHHIPRHGA